ncbi:phage baseplate assembly protein V [Sphingobium yanoikuyae]|uniref:Baseplate assembly protein n=1 Tax=Sphingobium yanoikuyae TaxID=13690 RepID=A0A291N6N7_SPHYA|nr:phage baseplate assembly protein V [Sphingobium yanoikuyae]ATI82901.1 baseplate assembly protein [Sphingobium yanoikuyae]
MAYTQDPQQQIGDAIQYGVVATVDHANATCTVTLGDLDTGELPWVAQRAGGMRCWSPPTVGEQCVVLAPEGDLANGLVILGLYSDANPPPSNSADVVQIDMPDGATIAYDHAAHALSVTLPAGGTATIDAPGGATINGPVTINGLLTVNDDVSVTGTATASEDVIGAGKSLKGHRHGNVQAGTAQTGAPV